jgi:hypothetical protein
MEEATRANSASMVAEPGGPRGQKVADVAALAGNMLKGDYRIASFSITWLGHACRPGRPVQAAGAGSGGGDHHAEGDARAGDLVEDGGACMTEFGRTVRENGSGGTDHGTGGCAVLAGGAINGGRMLGRWPGLGDQQLLDQRDLTPTADLRELAAAMLYRQFDVSADDLTGEDLSRRQPSTRARSFLRV